MPRSKAATLPWASAAVCGTAASSDVQKSPCWICPPTITKSLCPLPRAQTPRPSRPSQAEGAWSIHHLPNGLQHTTPFQCPSTFTAPSPGSCLRSNTRAWSCTSTARGCSTVGNSLAQSNHHSEHCPRQGSRGSGHPATMGMLPGAAGCSRLPLCCMLWRGWGARWLPLGSLPGARVRSQLPASPTPHTIPNALSLPATPSATLLQSFAALPLSPLPLGSGWQAVPSAPPASVRLPSTIHKAAPMPRIVPCQLPCSSGHTHLTCCLLPAQWTRSPRCVAHLQLAVRGGNPDRDWRKSTRKVTLS